MFKATYWTIIFIMTLITSVPSWKNEIKDARYKSGHREINDGTPFLTRLRYAFFTWLVIVTIIYIVKDYVLK